MVRWIMWMPRWSPSSAWGVIAVVNEVSIVEWERAPAGHESLLQSISRRRLDYGVREITRRVWGVVAVVNHVSIKEWERGPSVLSPQDAVKESQCIFMYPIRGNTNPAAISVDPLQQFCKFTIQTMVGANMTFDPCSFHRHDNVHPFQMSR